MVNTYAVNGIDLVEERGPNNRLLATYTYNTYNDYHQVLTETRYADAQTPYTTTYNYDAQRRLSSRQTPSGLTTTFSYGPNNYLSQTQDQPTGRIETFTWLNGYVRTHTDAIGLTLTYSRDALGRLTQVDYPDGTSLQYSYVLQPGQGFNDTPNPIAILDVTAVKDRLNKWTYYGYDRLRRLTSVKDARNNTTSYTYCGCGSLATITYPLGKVTTYLYNNAGWKTEVIYPDNTSQQYQYNLLGQMTVQAEALGSRTFAYNNQGLLITINNAAGLEQGITYDIYDDQISLTDANGLTINQTFDFMGRVLTRTYPDAGVERFGYSASGLTAYTNQLDKVTAYQYDAARRKTQETNPNGEVILYAYNTADDLTSLRDGKSQYTRWEYDTEGRVTVKRDDNNAIMFSYGYDANGRLTSRWSPAKGYTYYGYDDVGNLTSVNYPASPDISLTYDALNRVTSQVDAAGSTSYTYTYSGNLATEDGPWANDTVTYTYHNSVPRLRTSLSLQQPSGIWNNGLGYDAAKRLQTLTAPMGNFTYTYKGAGNLWTNLALPNTAAITNDFDSSARLLGTYLRNSSGAVLNKHTYLYNTAHERTRHTRTDGSYVSFTYDNISQLKTAVGSGGQSTENLGYLYDTAWNLNKRTNNGVVATFIVDNKNQLTNAPSVGTQTYDDNGNVTYSAGNSRGYGYDDENRLVNWYYYDGGYNGNGQPTSPADLRSEFVYDGLGRLRKRVEYTATSNYPYSWGVSSETRYIYDGRLVIQERNVSNTPAVSYTRGVDLSGSFQGAGGIGGLLARSHGYSGGNWSTHNYYHADSGGNVTYMISSAQAMVASYKYDPYGKTLSSSGTLAGANVYRFSSKEIHVNSGLYYYGFRFYDPNLQRWLNRDPIGEWGGINMYLFVYNCPSSFIDPYGMHKFNPGRNIYVCIDICRQNMFKNKMSFASQTTKKFGAGLAIGIIGAGGGHYVSKKCSRAVGRVITGTTSIIAVFKLGNAVAQYKPTLFDIKLEFVKCLNTCRYYWPGPTSDEEALEAWEDYVK